MILRRPAKFHLARANDIILKTLHWRSLPQVSMHSHSGQASSWYGGSVQDALAGGGDIVCERQLPLSACAVPKSWSWTDYSQSMHLPGSMGVGRETTQANCRERRRQ